MLPPGKPVTLVCMREAAEVLRKIADEIIEGPPSADLFYEDEEYPANVDPKVYAARPDLHKEVLRCLPPPPPARTTLNADMPLPIKRPLARPLALLPASPRIT